MDIQPKAHIRPINYDPIRVQKIGIKSEAEVFLKKSSLSRFSQDNI